MATKRFSAFWFLLPGLVGFAVFYIAPFLVSLSYTFLDKPVGGAFVGLRNYRELLGNSAYRTGLRNILRFIGVTVGLGGTLSLGLALLVHRLPRHRELFSLIILMPLVIPSGSMAFFWKSLFGYNGAINGLLVGAGLEKVNWLDSSRAFWVMVLIFLWKNLGYNMVLFRSGLSGIPVDFYEAARVDGAGRWTLFFRITLPQLAPTAVLVVMMSLLNTFKVFREIYLITGSYPHESIYTLQHFMNNLFGSLNYPRLTTAASLLVLGIALLTQLLMRLERRASA